MKSSTTAPKVNSGVTYVLPRPMPLRSIGEEISRNSVPTTPAPAETVMAETQRQNWSKKEHFDEKPEPGHSPRTSLATRSHQRLFTADVSTYTPRHGVQEKPVLDRFTAFGWNVSCLGEHSRDGVAYEDEPVARSEHDGEERSCQEIADVPQPPKPSVSHGELMSYRRDGHVSPILREEIILGSPGGLETVVSSPLSKQQACRQGDVRLCGRTDSPGRDTSGQTQI